MADRGSTDSRRSRRQQLELDFQLPDDVAERRRRQRAIRHHFFLLLEGLTYGSGLSAGQWRSMVRTLKALLKSDVTSWDGTGTFRANQVADDWMIGERTLYRHLSQAQAAGLIDRSISTDHYGRKRTTIEFRWQSIARRVGQHWLPESVSDQPATVSDQPATVSDQPATVSDQPATVAGSNYRLLRNTPTTTPVIPEPDGWSAAAADLARQVPDLSPGCLDRPRAAGVPPDHVLAIARHWIDHPGAWGVGALYRRIQRAVPGLAVEAGWPPMRVRAERPVPDRVLSVEYVRAAALRGYRAPAGMALGDVAEQRDRIVSDALRRAGIEEVPT